MKIVGEIAVVAMSDMSRWERPRCDRRRGSSAASTNDWHLIIAAMAGEWMWINMKKPPNMIVIGFDPYPCVCILVGGFNPSEKYEFVSWDDEIPHWMTEWKNNPILFQTTNQLLYFFHLGSDPWVYHLVNPTIPWKLTPYVYIHTYIHICILYIYIYSIWVSCIWGRPQKHPSYWYQWKKPWFREAPCSRPLLSKMTRAEMFECVFWESMVSNMRTSEECKGKNRQELGIWNMYGNI